MNSRARQQRLDAVASTSLTVCCHDLNSPRRQRLESLIRSQYLEAHGAELHDFCPYFLTLEQSSGEVAALLGMRPAAAGPLFLEGYLDSPVEQLLAQASTREHGADDLSNAALTSAMAPRSMAPRSMAPRSTLTRSTVTRDGVVELGNLVSFVPGGMRLLFGVAELWLRARKTQWAVFTATRTVRRGLRLQGFRCVELGDATRDHLDAEQADAWGTYYDNSPKVVGICHQSLRERTADLVWPAGLDPQVILDLVSTRTAEASPAVEWVPGKRWRATTPQPTPRERRA